MNASTSTMTANGALARAPLATKRPRAPSRRRQGPTKTLDLGRGNVLRVFGGRELHVAAISGVLWITEENCLQDTVLQPGESYRIAHDGLALILAHRGARVLLQMARGAPLPSRIDIARADGEMGRPVAFGRRQPSWPDRLKKALRAAVRRWEERAMLPRRALVQYY